MQLGLNATIETLAKLQKPQIAALKKLELHTVQDLLLYFPYRYLDFSQIREIKNLEPHEMVSISGKIKSINSRFSFKNRISLSEALISDQTGTVKVIWFNQPYLVKVLNTHEEIFIAGTPEIYNGTLQFVNPIYEKVTDFPIHTARLLPLYHLTAKLYHKTLRNLIAKALNLKAELTDILPAEILNSQNLPNIQTTVQLAHFPKTLSDIELTKTRLAFEEIFINQLASQKYKLELQKKKTFPVKFNQPLIQNFVNHLPFKLTLEQKKASWEILQDLEKPLPMNRLLEGDVGSGKTLVALIAALECISEGLQVVFIVPTEILAQQHHKSALKFFDPKPNFNTRIILLTQNFSKINNTDKEKKEILEELSLGMPGLYIGTHALLEKSVKFKNLSLVIIDEQHRFGVEQRSLLIKKSKKNPHLLSLSATPIPRSLQLAFFGELDISQIKHKPNDRKSIITQVIAEAERINAYNFVRKELQKGRQAFVITPLIEESQTRQTKSAKQEFTHISKIFSEFKVGLLHGKLKGVEKEAIMKDFSANKIQILVSTSVVEVGVDVPNASVMLIEGAERFGLAQLHQFRGRVGRAEHQSYCFLFESDKTTALNTSPSSSLAINGKNPSKQRLEVFSKTQDGFKLAELDLKLRGFGELYGSSQSGWNFKYFDNSYINLIPKAKEEALKILQNDTELNNYPLLKNKIKDKIIHFE